MINTPRFWRKKNFFSFILTPFSIIYFLGIKIYEFFSKEKDIGIPVICVGNLVAGGSGKTPITIELRKLLNKEKSKIFVLTRGYKGKLNGPMMVSKNSKYIDVSDEAIIHAKHGLTCMAKDKKKGADFCKKGGADLIIMDDGLQSKDIKKKFKILVVDAEYGFGNELILPAGPLRHLVGYTIKRCDVILVIRENDVENLIKIKNQKNIFYAEKKIKLKKLKYKNVLAFSGLGNNESFINKLQNLNINLKITKRFPDHHKYSESEVSKIIKIAREQKLSIVCTEKDYVKIPSKYKKYINVAYLEIKIFSSKKLIHLIKEKLIKI